jgi:ferredoxin-nitrite reductase
VDLGEATSVNNVDIYHRTDFYVGETGKEGRLPMRTGTSFLSEETIKRAEEGSPVEKGKLAKDATSNYIDVYDFARQIREGEMDWQDLEKFEFQRLKWNGIVHRDKRTPGQFMVRLRLPNGITDATSMRFYADTVEPYGPEKGVIDITTRQNIQMRGLKLEDADKMIDGLHELGQSSLQSALDNVRNMVGNPLAGIDEHEMVDTRPFCRGLDDLITLNPDTLQRGNAEWGNLGRKFNIAVEGNRDYYAHTHINDIGFQPNVHAETGEMGFNVVLGGYMSTKRVAESIDMDVWIPEDVDVAVAIAREIVTIFRDDGDRSDRQKARLMWLVESYGPVTEVHGHARADPGFKEKIISMMAARGQGYEKMVDVQQPRPKEPHPREGMTPGAAQMGVHKQPQEGLNRVGIHVPCGRLSVEETRQIADLAEKYSPNGEIRLTVEQSVILPHVKDEHIQELLAEPALNGDSRLRIAPGRILGNMVSWTGAQFCGLAMIETKNNAEATALEVEKMVDLPRDVRVHWTGCPNSCGQVQAADIGLMGGPAKKADPESGKLKAVPGVKMFIGGTIGEKGKLQLETAQEGIPIEDLPFYMTDVLINHFDGTVMPEYADAYKAWQMEQAAAKAAAEQEAAAKAAKKAAAAAKKAAAATA